MAAANPGDLQSKDGPADAQDGGTSEGHHGDAPAEISSLDAPAKTERGAEFRAFLIADIRGYTPYTDEHGDEAAARLASRFAELVRETVIAHDGTLLELRGDEALTIFTSARQALLSAVDLQARIAADALPRGVGVGLDAGEAVPVAGGYRGAALNVAARLCAQAAAGRILSTETVIRLAGRTEGIRYGPPRSVRLKGLEHPVRIVDVEPEVAPTTLGQSATGRASTQILHGRAAVTGLVAIAVLVIGGSLLVAQGLGGRGSAAPGGSGSTAPAESGSLNPEVSTSPGSSPSLAAADVPAYKGGLARTNQLPGPGPKGSASVRWEARTSFDMSGSPVVVGGLVFAGDTAGTLHVLDLATGQEQWTYDAGAPISMTPAVAGDAVYVSTQDGVFHAVDLTNHTERWSVPGVSVGTVPTIVGNSAYVGMGSGQFTALSIGDEGRPLWHVDVEGAANRIAVADGIAYVTSSDSGRVYAIDLTSQAIRWSVQTDGDAVLTPAILDDTLYATVVAAAGRGSRVTALDAATGEERWRFTPLDGAGLYSLAIGPDLAYTSSDTPGGVTVWALDRLSGDLSWLKEGSFAPEIHPTLVDGDLYLPSWDGVVDLNAATGQEIWRSGPVGRSANGPLVVTGGLILMNRDAGTTPQGVVALEGRSDTPATLPSSTIEWVTDLTAGDDRPSLYLNVVADAEGNVYAADRVGNRVVIWDPAGRPTSWGERGSGPGQFDFSEVTRDDQSQSVAVAPDGRIAVGDGGNHRVQIFDAERRFLQAIGREGTNDGEFINPCCVTFGPDGHLYVADAGRNDIQAFDEKGTYLRTIGSKGSGNGQFMRLGVPFVDPGTGELYVPDFDNRRIEVMTPEGEFVTAFGYGYGTQPFAKPNGVVLDRSGRMFIVDTNDLVYILDPAGKLIARFGPEVVAGHGLISPPYLWLTDDGRLYLPDVAGDRVAVFQLREPLWPPPRGDH